MCGASQAHTIWPFKINAIFFDTCFYIVLLVHKIAMFFVWDCACFRHDCSPDFCTVMRCVSCMLQNCLGILFPKTCIKDEHRISRPWRWQGRWTVQSKEFELSGRIWSASCVVQTGASYSLAQFAIRAQWPARCESVVQMNYAKCATMLEIQFNRDRSGEIYRRGASQTNIKGMGITRP